MEKVQTASAYRNVISSICAVGMYMLSVRLTVTDLKTKNGINGEAYNNHKHIEAER